jgi:hypothetical protein
MSADTADEFTRTQHFAIKADARAVDEKMTVAIGGIRFFSVGRECCFQQFFAGAVAVKFPANVVACSAAEKYQRNFIQFFVPVDKIIDGAIAANDPCFEAIIEIGRPIVYKKMIWNFALLQLKLQPFAGFCGQPFARSGIDKKRYFLLLLQLKWLKSKYREKWMRVQMSF